MQNIVKYVALSLVLSVGHALAQKSTIVINGPVTIAPSCTKGCPTTKTDKPTVSNTVHKPAAKKIAAAPPQPAPATPTSPPAPATPPADNKLMEVLVANLQSSNANQEATNRIAEQIGADNARANQTAQMANAINAESVRLKAQNDAVLAQAAMKDAETRGQLATIEGQRVAGFNGYLHTHGNVEKWEVGAHYAGIAVAPWVAHLGRTQINDASSTILDGGNLTNTSTTSTSTANTGTSTANGGTIAPGAIVANGGAGGVGGQGGQGGQVAPGAVTNNPVSIAYGGSANPTNIANGGNSSATGGDSSSSSAANSGATATGSGSASAVAP